MNAFKEGTQKIIGGWKNLDSGKKKALVLAVTAITLFAVLYTVYSQKVTYGTLFTNLEIQDAALIAQDLEANGKVKYKLENGGKDILMDVKHIDKYRLELATKGMMPQNSMGYEIFDNMGMMVTDEDRRIMYQRALEGELQRSIMSIGEIESARVHLVMSEDSIFETERREASASVILNLKMGSTISQESVTGIVALITGAVDNLPESQVKVIDSKGNLLNFATASGEGPSLGLVDQQREIKKSFEKEIEESILGLLGPAFRADKIKIAVYADLDFDAQEQTVISYENPVKRSEQYSAVGGELNAGQVTDNPIGDNVQNVLDGGDGALSSIEGTTNYELTETKTNTIKAPGKVERISTSVLYDGNLSAAQLESIRNLVSTATGYDDLRGDLISIEGVEFDKSFQDEMDKQAEQDRLEILKNRTFMEKYQDYIYLGLFIVLGLVIIGSVVKVAFGKKKSRKDEEFEMELHAPMAAQPEVGQNVDIVEEVYKKFEVKENQQEKQVKEYAEEHPEIAADLIKAWMKD